MVLLDAQDRLIIPLERISCSIYRGSVANVNITQLIPLQFHYGFQFLNGSIQREPCFESNDCLRSPSKSFHIFGHLNAYSGFIVPYTTPSLAESMLFPRKGFLSISLQWQQTDYDAMVRETMSTGNKTYIRIRDVCLISGSTVHHFPKAKLRLAGASSLRFAKKTYVIKLPAHVDGVRKFKLRASAVDPSASCELVTARILESVGATTFRVGHARLVVNAGVYTFYIRVGGYKRIRSEPLP